MQQPAFNEGDKVKTLVGKNEPDKIHRSHRKGSVGVIEQVGHFNDGKTRYWINFGKEQNAWYLPSELKPVKP